MKTNITRIAVVAALAGLLSVAISGNASAQQPVAYTTVQPAVVGYEFEWRGLLGLQSRWNPVVAPVATTTVVSPPPAVVPAVTTVNTYYTPPAVAPATYVTPVSPVTTYHVRY